MCSDPCSSRQARKERKRVGEGGGQGGRKGPVWQRESEGERGGQQQDRRSWGGGTLCSKLKTQLKPLQLCVLNQPIKAFFLYTLYMLHMFASLLLTTCVFLDLFYHKSHLLYIIFNNFFCPSVRFSAHFHTPWKRKTTLLLQQHRNIEIIGCNNGIIVAFFYFMWKSMESGCL